MAIHIYRQWLTFIFITIGVSSYAQKKASHWPFADYELNFNKDTVNVTRTYAPHLDRGMGVISDDNGNLLMYTDGYSVFNKNHQQMPNGGNLIPSTTATSTQESLIIPKPGNSNVYYIFSVDPWNGQATSGLYYSTVDLTQAGGLGDITTKGTRLVQNTSSYLSATFHANGRDVWLITHQNNTNKYFLALITDQGISPSLIEQDLGASRSFWGGQLKFSPDGRKIAVSYSSGVSLFDFDKSNGVMSNEMDFSFTDVDASAIIGGLEFSSDGTKVYTYNSDYSDLYQFDISLGSFDQIRKSRYQVPGSILFNDFNQFQLAPDGKIYVTKGGGGGGTDYLGVIVNPNAPGPKVIVKENGLYLEGGDSFVNYTPNFIQDYFFKTSFKYNGHCQGSLIKFAITNEYRLDSAHWYFGEGSTSKSRTPSFQYDIPGKYEVTLLAYYSGVADTIRQELNINPYTQFDLGKDTVVCRGSKFSVREKFVSYRWNTGDTTHTIRFQQQGKLTLTAINSWGCAFKDSLIVTIAELPVITLPDSIKMGNLAAVQLDPGNFSSYTWSTEEITHVISVGKEGWYSVEVKNTSGCHAAKSVFVSDNAPPVSTPASKWILLNPLPSRSAGTDIYFLDEQNGFIVNGKELLQTHDRGDSWKIQMQLPNGKRISFKNSIGYVVGDVGTVYKSTQYGGGWNKLNFPSTVNLNAVTLLHPDTVRITSDNNLFVSNDGGKTWASLNVNGVDIEDSYFTSAKVGHVACKNGTILKTTDGGATWRSTLSSHVTPSNFFRIKFVNKLVGYASREFSDIYKTTDGGESWMLTATSTPDGAYAMQFLDEKVGFIAGEDGAIDKTDDGGDTWNWAGYDGRIYGGDLYAIFFVDENQGYAAGNGGRIIRTFDGGKTWTRYSLTYTINQLSFTSEKIGYFLLGNELFKTSNQGVNWVNLGSPLPNQKTARFDFVSDSVGFAIVGGDLGTSASSNKVYKTTNGGVNWTRADKDNNLGYGDYSCISFANAQVGLVSGSYGSGGFLRTTNGGANWSSVSVGATIGQIQFLNDNVGYARNIYNSNNRISKTMDGGVTWNTMIELAQTINYLYFINQSTGFFVATAV